MFHYYCHSSGFVLWYGVIDIIVTSRKAQRRVWEWVVEVTQVWSINFLTSTVLLWCSFQDESGPNQAQTLSLLVVTWQPQTKTTRPTINFIGNEKMVKWVVQVGYILTYMNYYPKLPFFISQVISPQGGSYCKLLINYRHRMLKTPTSGLVQ